MLDTLSNIIFVVLFVYYLRKLGDAIDRRDDQKKEYMEETLTVLKRINENLENLSHQMNRIDGEITQQLGYKNINYYIRNINEKLSKFINEPE
jgi:uncharacterized membrane protein YhiD involved in acid resistance